MQRKPRNWPSITGSQKERSTEAFRRLEDMTRLISDWVWETDADGALIYVSERMIDRLGIHPVQVIGQRLDQIGQFVQDGQLVPAPDQKRPFRDVYFEAKGHDGKLRHFAVSALPRFDHETGDFFGATGIAKDVTELVRVERANSRLADAIEVLSGYFALYDEDDKLVISNSRFRDFNREFKEASRPGAGFETLLRKELEAGRYPDASGEGEEWIKNRLQRRQANIGPHEQMLSGGRWLYIDEEKLPDGGTVMMAHDISDLKRAMEALQTSVQHHREFSANVAHKLRTPLAVLRANLDSLGKTSEVKSLKHEVDVLARMVEQLLTLTRYEYLVLPQNAYVDLYMVLVDVISALAPMALKEDRALELDSDNEKIWVRGDAGALEHALRNLIENAVKYSSRGSTVRIVIERDPLTVRIIDQGRGIPEDQRDILFERFAQNDRRGAGAGLGLSIVKAIFDAHGAEIDISDTSGGGATFSIKFPTLDERARKSVCV